jgi:hypothetical protein
MGCTHDPLAAETGDDCRPDEAGGDCSLEEFDVVAPQAASTTADITIAVVRITTLARQR